MVAFFRPVILQRFGLVLHGYGWFIRPAKELPANSHDDGSCLFNLAKQVISLFHPGL